MKIKVPSDCERVPLLQRCNTRVQAREDTTYSYIIRQSSIYQGHPIYIVGILSLHHICATGRRSVVRLIEVSGLCEIEAQRDSVRQGPSWGMRIRMY